MQRGLRQLEGTGHPVHLDVARGDAGGIQCLQRTVEQALGDRLVEARDDDGESGAGA